MREGLDKLVGIISPEGLAELNARSRDSRSLIRAAYKWQGCVDCGRAPWKSGKDYVPLSEMEGDHIDNSIKGPGAAANGGVGQGHRRPGSGQDMWSFFVELIKTEPRCRKCHDKLRGKQRNGQRNGYVETHEVLALFEEDPTYANGYWRPT